MKEEKDILKQIGHRDGMTVPEGYFADFAARMAASLPSTPFEEQKNTQIRIAKRTTWQKIRPYVYMAAMFMGVWCMLKMFTLLTAKPDAWEPSPILAEALGNETFVNEYIIDDIDQWDLIDDLYAEGVDPAEINEQYVPISDEEDPDNQINEGKSSDDAQI